MGIKVLPANIANLIAAGEVVQRPASVVKELVENAVDAGAKDITVIIKDAGRTLIQVIDNGKGMSRDEAIVCFERHATSKLETAADLHNILTFGFRGEALASIAAVAQVSLRTRRKEDELGVEVLMEASQQVDLKQVACPVGCNIVVRNLFYNIPARRKFLKSDNIEFKHIIDEFIRVALTQQDVSFTLKHNDKDIYNLKAAKSLKFRVLDLLGSSIVGDVVDIHSETSIVDVQGLIGRPNSSKKTLGNQYFFVNGRFFKSAYMHKAVMKAYEEYIPEGFTPSYFLYLTVNPNEVDVNIHPSKTEIKFENDTVIYQTIYASVKETLARHSFGTSIDFDVENTVPIPNIGKHFDEFYPEGVDLNKKVDENYDPFDEMNRPLRNLDFEKDDFTRAFVSTQEPTQEPTQGGVAGMEQGFSPQGAYAGASQGGLAVGGQGGYTTGEEQRNVDYSKYIDKREDYGPLFENQILAATNLLILQGKYIIKPSKSGFLLINVARAYERIVYDEFLAAISAKKEKRPAQSLIFPINIAVGKQGVLIISEHKEKLEQLGFDLQIFGEENIAINAIPSGFSSQEKDVQNLIIDLIKILEQNKEQLDLLFDSQLAASLSNLVGRTHSAVHTISEAEALLNKLYSSLNPEYTVSGKKIISLVSIEELDKRF